MPRYLRIEYEDALYHVMSRGNGKQRIFFGSDDYQRFLRQLADNLETFDVVLYAYVLMPNHYHLLVRTRHANLSRFMQRLNTSYALYARYKHGRPGHQLEGRYKAFVLSSLTEDDEPLRKNLAASNYAIGSEEYVKEIERKLRERKTGSLRDRDVSMPKTHINIKLIDDVVSRYYKINPKQLICNGHRKGAGKAKAVAIEMACRLTSRSQRQIGKHYGGISSQAVSIARKRMREAPEPVQKHVLTLARKAERLYHK